MREHFLLASLALLLSIPGQGQTPFIYAFSQDTSVNLTRGRVFDRIGPDLYRVFGGSGNDDSAWVYRAEMDAAGILSNMEIIRCDTNMTDAMPSCVLPTSDQGLLHVFGFLANDSNRYVFVKTDASGAVQWQRYYPQLYGQVVVDSQYGLAEKDGHYFTLGHVSAVPSNEGWANTMLELDSAGGCVTQRTWAAGDGWTDTGFGIVHTTSNGLLTVSIEHPYFSNASYPYVCVQSWNAAMAVEWSNRYSLGYMHSLVRVLATSDGGSLITGQVFMTNTSPLYPFFLRLDGTGQVLWARMVLEPGLVPSAAVEEPDSGFVLALWKSPAVPIVARLDGDGTLISAQRATGLDYNVIPWGLTRDSITGEHLVHGTGGPDNTTYLFRLDASLAFHCGSNADAWTDSLVTPGVSAFPVTVSTQPRVSFDSLLVPQPVVFSCANTCIPTALPQTPEPHDDVWPVPTDEVVNVTWNGMLSGPVNYALLDGTGRLVERGSAARTVDGTVIIDVRDVVAGSYVLRLEDSGVVRAVRVVRR